MCEKNIKRHKNKQDNRQKRQIVICGLILSLMMLTGCSDSVYMEKTYEADSADGTEDNAGGSNNIVQNESANDTETAEAGNTAEHSSKADTVKAVSTTEHSSKTEEQEALEETENNTEKEQQEKILVVYICGAVVNPGVYELPQDARVVQAIEAAGGLREDADTVTVNQAKRLEDGEQIQILTKEEAEAVKSNRTIEGGETSGEPEKININLADAAALMTLPGIGQAKADAIIEYREANGKFTSITDIMKISGIKESVFSKIEDLITV